MDINILLIIAIALCTGLIAFCSFSKEKTTLSRVLIALLIIIQILLTVYKGYLDEHLQSNLKMDGVTINWTTGQVVSLSNKNVLVSYKMNSNIQNNSSLPNANDPNPSISNNHIDTTQFTEIPDKDLPKSDCILTGSEEGFFHGRFYLISSLPEKVLLYRISGNQGDVYCNMLISPNESVLTPLVRSGLINNKPDSIAGAEQYDYYFRTVDSGAIKFGSLQLTVRACKIRTQIISSKNLYLGAEISHPSY